MDFVGDVNSLDKNLPIYIKAGWDKMLDILVNRKPVPCIRSILKNMAKAARDAYEKASEADKPQLAGMAIKISYFLEAVDRYCLSDILQGMEQVRMFAQGRATVEEYIQKSRLYAKKSNRGILLLACLESANRGFDLLCSLVFLAIGVLFVQRGYTTLGALAAIYTLYGSFSFQFLQMNRYIPELIAYLTYAQNIFDLLEQEREDSNWYTKKQLRGIDKDADDTWMVSMRDVSFSYDEKKVLENYSIVVQRGECVALTGTSGCGKSTVSKLLLGLYPIESGDICVLGNSVKKITI